MSTITGTIATPTGTNSVPAARPRRLMPDLERPAHALRDFGPNWFAVVMGTGIVANAAATLPRQFTGLHAAATVVWALAALLLLTVGGAFAAHWIRHPENARAHGTHPVMSHFYGAPPMALLTVGAGTLLLGRDVIGLPAAVAADWALWLVGTILGLATAVTVPYRMITRHRYTSDAAFGGWLMPVVPPMVSAATGALLIPHTPAGQLRLTMVLSCYAMFGLSLIAAFLVITMLYSRLVHHGLPAAGAIPTLWIVLGPLGQSVTAAGLLANAAQNTVPTPYASGLAVSAVLFGVATWGFAMSWLALVTTVTIRTARNHLPFSLTWWGFTFPVGTCVTGSTALASRTGAELFAWTAVALYALLVTAWAVVAVRTARGALRGALFLPPAPVPTTTLSDRSPLRATEAAGRTADFTREELAEVAGLTGPERPADRRHRLVGVSK